MLETQIVWKITLEPARKGKHELEIKIFNYENSDKPSSKIISLPFTLDEISNFQSKANDKNLVWTDNLTIEVSQIAQAYTFPLPNPIVTYCNFDEEDQFLQYGEFYVLDVYYNCVDLKASLIEVHLKLPQSPWFWFCFDWVIIRIVEWLEFLKFFKNKNMAGVYVIKEAEGFQKPAVLEGGRAPILKFEKSGELDNFPRINFHFFSPVKPILSFMGAFLLWLVVSKIHSWLFG